MSTMTERRWEMLPVVSSTAEASERGLQPGEFRFAGWSFEQHMAALRPRRAEPDRPPSRSEILDRWHRDAQVREREVDDARMVYVDGDVGVGIRLEFDLAGVAAELGPDDAEGIGALVQRRLAPVVRQAVDDLYAELRSRVPR